MFSKHPTLINRKTRIVIQGILGRHGHQHALSCLKYARGKDMFVFGTHPLKSPEYCIGLFTFLQIEWAVREAGVNASLIFVPASNVLYAIKEAVKNALSFLICVAEGIRTKDALLIRNVKIEGKTKPIILGPNCPGMVVPNCLKVGIMPVKIFGAGEVIIISRSGTLTYEVVSQLSEMGIGQAVAVGIGGDMMRGLDFRGASLWLGVCNKPSALTILISEIGGAEESEVASLLWAVEVGPIMILLAGKGAPEGKRMGHAGALVSSQDERVVRKARLLRSKGLIVISSLLVLGRAIKEARALASSNSLGL
ncbi:succinyl-CoA synthetase subunit alpha [Candidatus Tremblaya phenacola PAVE]|nr:succinyl-CoA synthetase subunit alpha [Candidatus Tremblaya phenacola PAVE]